MTRAASSRPLPIAADHPAFAGHFPGMPILPGVVLLDAALTVIEIERALDLTQWQLGAAKFQGAVRPGETPVVEHSAPDHGSIQFTVRVGERAVLTGRLSQLSVDRHGLQIDVETFAIFVRKRRSNW